MDGHCKMGQAGPGVQGSLHLPLKTKADRGGRVTRWDWNPSRPSA